MENKLPHDELEKFIRDSFNQYTDKPSEQVWSKIDNTLDNPIRSALSPKRRWLPWSIAAASAGLIIYLTATNIHLKYQLKTIIAKNTPITSLDHMSSKDESSQVLVLTEVITPLPDSVGRITSTPMIVQEAQSVTSSSLNLSKVSSAESDAEKSNSNVLVTDSKKSSSSSKDADRLNENMLEPVLKKSKAQIKVSPKTEPNLNKTLPTRNIAQIATQHGSIHDQTSRTNHSVLAGQNKKFPKGNQDSALFSSKELSPNIETGLSQKSGSNLNDHPLRSFIEFHALPLSKDALLASFTPIKHIQATVFTHMVPVSVPAHTTSAELNVFAGLLSESGFLSEKHRFNPLPFSQPSNHYSTTHAWYTGVGYSASLNKNWYINTGIGYKRFELVNQVTQSLTFKDRKGQFPGGLPSQHDWDFKLNCPGGTSNITIQSEQLDSRATIGENELIKVNISNHEETGYLSLPLSIHYRTTGPKKLSFSVGAGIHMNFLMSSHFESPAIKIDHPQLTVRKEIKRDYHFDQTNNLVLNGILSASIAYAVSPRIKLQLSPAWYLPFTNRISDRNVKVNSTSYGLQLGVNYSIASL